MFGSTYLYCFVVLAFGLAVSAVRSERTTLASSTMNITAITGKQGVSVLECWALAAKFATSTQAGTVGAANLALGDLANATFTVLPPRFNGGEHNAPSVQYVSFLSGTAVVTLPNSTDSVTIRGGKDGLIIAADTAAVSAGGHITTYPTSEETTALQIPTLNGAVPAHTVLHSGACASKETELR